jgi:hypothetical protein
MLMGAFRVAIAEALTRKRRPAQATLTEEMWRFVVAGVRFIREDERPPRAVPGPSAD